MRISVVIPNYNGRKLLERNLPKVLEAVKNAEVIIVDDASTDDSCKVIQKSFPQVKLIERHKNEGFAASVNIGVKHARDELILLLNTDVYPEKNFLDSLMPHFRDEKVFGAGCLQYSGEGKGQTIHGRGIGKFDRGFLIHAPGATDKKNTLWVFGGAGVFRKSIWEKLGGMNEAYSPFYWEDLDLSYRALKAGYTLVFEPESVVHHEQGISIKTTYSSTDVKTIAYRNQILFVWFNITDYSWILLHFIFLPYHLVKAIFSFDFAFVNAFLQALTMIHKVLYQRLKNKKLMKITDRQLLANYID